MICTTLTVSLCAVMAPLPLILTLPNLSVVVPRSMGRSKEKEISYKEREKVNHPSNHECGEPQRWKDNRAKIGRVSPQFLSSNRLGLKPQFPPNCGHSRNVPYFLSGQPPPSHPQCECADIIQVMAFEMVGLVISYLLNAPYLR